MIVILRAIDIYMGHVLNCRIFKPIKIIQKECLKENREENFSYRHLYGSLIKRQDFSI